ncbi:MAG: LysM peptidoglycan-binding domain-containing protein [Rhodococcus sp.]|uniref:LysM peptidoglycan-binding domain-containing protein n=1 Tax=Rhodococcus qingshengii JCM 15477 TaxID=1303681 RepID=A0AB38RP36_RHOSG|nr:MULTISPECIES: LysM peptidoglycan-binding domain-containing protein [Rhodococcus]MCC4306083.1 LysM peptidoglycan-binding domain-containing protein [Rhodococcus sp. 3-2]MCW0191487.1 LysM peptidoglycan-binding domain-containing protein [Rhodococcus sp. (in: high G+C Gram-positive bacteria)]UPU46991.1 LysM peptidoglycan-binding domain-containing protein [Rhodococcus qingshengii JCM 15477]
MNVAAARLKGLLYLIALLALTAGIPFALYTFAGNPLAGVTSLTFDAIKEALTTQDDGTLFLSALTIIGWIAWATFAYSIIIELAAALRGVKVRRIKGLQFQQHSAAILVSGALLLITAGTATATPAADILGPNHASPTSISAPAFFDDAQTQSPQQSAPSWTKTPAQTPAGTTIVTESGDTLWGLAERHLGDGTRYPEIQSLNQNAIPDEAWIDAGITLTLPAAPEKQLHGAYTVRAGDTLWDLAETYLGDGSRYPQIHGATGPLTTDVIQIGQQLFLTPAATGAEVAPPAPSPNSAAETPAAESSAPAPEIAPEPVPEPAPQPAPELVPDVAVSPTAAAPEAPTEAAPETPEVPVSSAPSEVAGEQSPLVVPDVPELQEMVPGGDEMAQAEARAAEEAAARIFGIEIPGAPAAEAAEPSVAEAPATEPAPQPAPPVSVEVPAPSEAPAAAPAPAPALDENSALASAPIAPGAPDSTISQSEQLNTPEIAPEPTPEPTPETGAQQATPADTQDSETLVPLNTTATQLPENAAATTALTSTDNAQDSKTVMGLSALAGIALLAGVGLFRRRQQNRRRRGERIPMPKESTALVEQQIRENADPSLLALLDNALRDVADICRTNSIPLPALLGVFLHDRSIELALVDDIELPAPWQRDTETSAWTITADDELDPPLTTVSPYPALVEIGEIEGGSRLLLNLEQLSHLGIAAPTAEARDIIRALAVFLAFSPLGDNLKLTLVGTGEALARPNTDGSALIEYASTADAVLERLARHTRTDAQALSDNGIDDIAQARIEYTDSAITNPEIILLSEPLTPAQREIFDNILANAPRVAFAAVTAADDPTADWTLTTRTDGSATLRRPGRPAFDLTPARISEAEFDAIIDVLETADADPIADAASQNDPWTAETFDDRIAEATSVDDLLPHQAPTVHFLATEPNFDTATTEFDDDEADTEPLTYLNPADESSINNTPATAENTPPFAMAIAPTPDNALSVDEHIWIHILGTPRVTALNEGSDVGRRPHLTELAALIATHPHPGIRGPQVDEKIWPKQTYANLSLSEQTTKRTARRNTAFTRLRNFLGETATGDLAFPKVFDNTGNTPYRLDDTVHTDWDIWNNLIGGHPATADHNELTTAVALVEGTPFTTKKAPARYGWAEELRQNMISELTDAIEELSARHLQEGDTRIALELAQKGLDVDEYHEGLWRLAIIATHGSDDITATQGLIDALLTKLAELDVDPNEQTSELLQILDDFHDTAGERPYRIAQRAS